MRPLVIASTDGLASRIARTLAERSGLPESAWQHRAMQFRRLAPLLAEEHEGVISGIHRQILLYEALTRKIPAQNSLLGPVAPLPGFLPMLTSALQEWKMAGILPQHMQQAYQKAEQQNSTLAPRLQEISMLFQGYQELLQQQNLIDEVDQLHKAICSAAQPSHPFLDEINLIIIDGFYHLYPLQISLLQSLAARTGCTSIFTLTCDPLRPRLFEQPLRTLQTLYNAFDCTQEEIPPRTSYTVSPALQHANLSLLAPEPPALAAGEEDAVLFCSAPNPYMEAELVARRLLKLHQSQQVPWHECALILHSPSTSLPLISAVFERFDIPLAQSYTQPLLRSPRAQALSHLLNMFCYDWQTEHVIAFLDSSCTAPNWQEKEQLRLKALRRGTRSGREAWMFLAAQISLGSTARTLLERIARAEQSCTAVEPHDLLDFTNFCLAEFCRVQQEENSPQQTAGAADPILQDAIESLANTLSHTGSPVNLQMWCQRLLHVLQHASCTVSETSGSRVQVMQPYETRDVPVSYAFLMGMVEGGFPRHFDEDPLFRDTERAELAALVPEISLEPRSNHIEEERFLFYLAVTTPSRQLMLSWPRSGEQRDLAPSFYLDDLKKALAYPGGENGYWQEQIIQLSDIAPLPEQAVTSPDHLLAGCALLFAPTAANVQQQQTLGMKHLEQHFEHDRLLLSEITESRLKPPLPRIVTPEMHRRFLAGKKAWNSRELESYARCPFQFYMAHILKIEPEPDQNDAALQSTILHHTLHRTFYTCKKQRKKPLYEDFLAALETEMQNGQLEMDEHRKPLVQDMLSLALKDFSEREQAYAKQFALFPTWFELAFGTGSGEDLAGDEDRSSESKPRNDPKSRPQCLQIALSNRTEPLQVCGIIDRVDLSADQTTGLILDYKLASAPSLKSIEKQVETGQALQLPLYMMALEQLWNIQAAGACYDIMHHATRPRIYLNNEHARSLGLPRTAAEDRADEVRPLNVQQWEDLKKSVVAKLEQITTEMENADIQPRPGTHCTRCPYSDVCRTTMNGHDGEEAI